MAEEAGSGWHLIEVYMKASSTKTSRDGIIRWALDGSGCLLARDLSKAWHHYWDHLYISGR